ncbi:hypothetical protein RHMOL_Rhmol12G0178000 [Rhododendron molle]|uniref:Uncharacterized protein n=2 Tax=Rhododendron molle TaxID=49168 RepID=A0ACC0LJM4_RHOML|nr:hypothetical protein RHMOL_Rhmol12G0178000 [Rhododendron molle]KAI8528831.1 hypothetical protein RHMOL_Rhmol12G0178000 [Rhododendron molle]
MVKAIQHCQSSQKSRRDTHLAVDQLTLGLLEDSQVGDLLNEAGVSPSRVKSEVEKLRGKEGRKVESASDDSNFEALKTYGRDLVEMATQLDPVIGRDEEIRRVVRILCRRTKNNPVLIGEPGVGKMVVVEEGSMDAANLFKPMLARGQLRCIGATTLDEYKKYVEKDAAFERRLQQVYVADPSVEDTISILRGLKERYEGHHGVRILDQALVVAAQLSARYITGRYLPD